MYQIFSDEVLGSGQFGIVYGGMFHFEVALLPVLFNVAFIAEFGVVYLVIHPILF